MCGLYISFRGVQGGPIILGKQIKLKELIYRAQNGDKDALNQVIERFKPIINKYANRFGSEDVKSEIIEWLINATLKYKEKDIWNKKEFEEFINKYNNKT